MTTTLVPLQTTTGADTRTFRRVVAAVLLPLGPLSVAILRGILPYFTAETSQDQLDQTASALGRMDAVVWLGLLAALTLVPSALAAARLAQRRAPRLTLAAIVLLVPAYLALPFVNNDILVRAAAADADRTVAVRLLDAASSHGAVTAASAVFLAGHLFGMILLGTALWRAHAIPAWAGIALIISQPLHIVFTVVGSPLLDACAWGLTALGLLIAASRVLRTANDDWDLGPAN
jgi:hypothetical protein